MTLRKIGALINASLARKPAQLSLQIVLDIYHKFGTDLPKESVCKIHELAELLAFELPWRTGMAAIAYNQRIIHERLHFEESERDFVMCLSRDATPAQIAH